jgi:hypothetical protein
MSLVGNWVRGCSLPHGFNKAEFYYNQKFKRNIGKGMCGQDYDVGT